MDPEEAVTAERLTRLIDRAYQLGMGAPRRSSSRSVIDLLRQVQDPPTPNSEAYLDDLVRAADSDPLTLRAAAAWALADSPTDPATLTAASLLFQASLRAQPDPTEEQPPFS